MLSKTNTVNVKVTMKCTIPLFIYLFNATTGYRFIIIEYVICIRKNERMYNLVGLYQT